MCDGVERKSRKLKAQNKSEVETNFARTLTTTKKTLHPRQIGWKGKQRADKQSVGKDYYRLTTSVWQIPDGKTLSRPTYLCQLTKYLLRFGSSIVHVPARIWWNYFIEIWFYENIIVETNKMKTETNI